MLTAESDGPGKGSTFAFSVPNAETESAKIENGAPRFLIVDDNRDAADSLTEIVRLLGCKVKIAYDGANALAVAQEFEPQAVLVDLGMPDMDGFEVAARLRRLPFASRMLIAAVTGYGNEDDRERTRAAGFDAHLVKPVELPVLQAFVEQALRASGDTPSAIR